MMNRPMLLLSLLLACATRPAQAQDDVRPDSVLLAGVLANGPSVSEYDVQSRCLELPGGWMDPDLRPETDGLPSSCEPQESGELERAGDRRYFWARYAHRTSLASGDSLREDEVVLFSAPLEGGRLTAEWHTRYDLDYWTHVQLAVGPTDGDGALVAVVSCVNGTGGCQQQFLLRQGGAWRTARQVWMEQLPDSIRGFWKGTYLNPMTLQGQAPLYSPDDANCCPSRTLYFRVRLEGDALVLRDHRAVAAAEQ
jgi:hypothetical protein